MNELMRKLRSRRGASMILAMVFMLFAVFIGGTILASAAANGYRVEHLSDQQVYLDQRSAALLIADELAPAGGTDLTFTIIDIVTLYQPVKIDDGGVVVDTTQQTTETHSITIKAPANLVMTPMQRVAVETAIGQYIQQSNAEIGEINLSGFYYDASGTKTAFPALTQFWMYSDDAIGTAGEIQISGTGTGVSLTGGDLESGFEANFKCCDGADLYDFVVDFGSSSQLVVTMDGYSGTNNPVTSSQVTEVSTSISTTGYARVSTTTTRTAISWSEPDVQKGGN